MKLTVIFCLLLIATACNNEPKKIEEQKKGVPENLIEYKNGIYTEYYPGRKKVKMTGAQDNKKVRNGKWVYLSEKGEEMCVSFYEKGMLEGHMIVKHPNGTINYVGEFLHGDQIGVWKFYNDQGKLIREEDYSQTPVKVTNFK